ncbi:hypothetical protein QVD17_16071 [Tagetes erecta]|uniref:Uncharacterized protein n=1 Tax=Tagetes erecta TaxID=13708 RepID=A0AAD8KTK1_TARER|nr:hypothetical protein QVD17_16071 [Tagetes erecta]
MDLASTTDFDFTFPSQADACYTSAPSSPTRLPELYCDFDKLLIAANDASRTTSLATVPFAWEEKPGVPKTPIDVLEDDFSFDVSCHFDGESTPSEYVFNYGIIKTVDPLPCGEERGVERERGRERGVSTSRLPSSRSRRTRSMSPLGCSDHRRQQVVAPLSPAPSTESGSKRWSLLDLLLFRSSSDGRAMDRDPLKKYSANFRKYDQDIRNSGSLSKRRGRVSAHELHYNVNRAVSNDMKKKTYLPYKHGILGKSSFNL